MNRKLRIALGQLNSRDDVEANFKVMEELLTEAAARKAELMVFPECSSTLSTLGASDKAESLEGPIINRFRNLAVKYAMDIHNGSFIEKDPETGAFYNTSVYIDSSGDIKAVYRKIHLFDVVLDKHRTYRESASYTAGSKVVGVHSPLGDFGFTICYDLRFPELFRRLALAGARLIFLPAAFTLFTGKDHWEALIRARAIENQVFIAAPGQFGERPGKKMSFGNSMVVDPWGTVIARARDGIDLVTADIDWDWQEEIRRKLPCLEHGREIPDVTWNGQLLKKKTGK